MAGFITRGQPVAIRLVSAMIAAGLPHALLLVGPQSVGKTTLALDIAAAQLCVVPDAADRPCRACRACRLVTERNHPDVHRLAPDGAGASVGIDAVRGLVSDLALLPVEGGARVAIIEAAHRMTEDAQNAVLKTLEEPPAGVTLILCAEDEDRLLPTILSRVARVRLGTLPPRDIEELLESRGEADAPTANRLARLAGGRPGLAIAYARSPDAAAIRAELARSLLDLAGTSRALRLVRIRELLVRAAELVGALAPAASAEVAGGRTPRRRKGGAGVAVAVTAAGILSAGASGAGASGAGAALSAGRTGSASDQSGVASLSDGSDTGSPDADAEATTGGGKATPAERRRGAATLLDVWRDTARDLALVGLGDVSGLHEPDLLEEFQRLSARLPEDAIGRFLVRLDRTAQLLDANANPELAMDLLALAWPRTVRAA